MRKSRPIIAKAVLALGLVAGAGCESTSSARRAALPTPVANPAWESVLHGREVAETPPAHLAHVATRRDIALALREPHPRTAIDGWQQEPRTTLDRQRRIFFSTTDRTFIYFRQERTDIVR
ncbi:MAG: hypothetical protein KIS87_10550 [Phycisphaeraceae bacterium]|nr:hypothetical protein [Phycisphaeraceae bacterium]